MRKALFTLIRRVVIIFLFIGVFLYFQANDLTTTHFTYTSDKVPEQFDDYKIVQITDLHSHTFGKNNARLIRAIDKVNPDLIVVTGDMMNSLHDEGEVFLHLAEQLAKRYLIYYIDGNHELIVKMKSNRQEHDFYPNFIERLEQLNVHIINDKTVLLKRGNEKIALTGLDIPLIFYSAEDADMGTYEFTKAYVEKKIGEANEELLQILLVHTPDYFPVYAEWGADLTLAGHHHGGMIRNPFMGVGGFVGHRGTLEFMPTYSAGEFKEGAATMYVGRGLGNYTINFRLFNRPELVVITLKK